MLFKNIKYMNLDCNVLVHKQCAVHLSDHCYPATQKTKSSAAKNSKKPFTSSTSNLFGASTSTQNRHESPSKPSAIESLRTSASTQPLSMNSGVSLGHLDRSTPELRSIHPPIPTSAIPSVPQQWNSTPPPPPPSSSAVENAKSTSSDSGIGTEVGDRPVLRSQSVRTKVCCDFPLVTIVFCNAKVY